MSTTTTVTVHHPSSIKSLLKRGSEVKFNLDFLRRTPKDFTPIRPSPEVAHAWSLSFPIMMSSQYGKSLFRAFLAREFSEENVDFWLAVEKFRTCKEKKLVIQANQIFTEFIICKAPKEVNLNSSMKSSLAIAVLTPSHTTFDPSQKIIQSMMEADGYSRFLKSELYLELAYPEES